jgi:phenylacetate-CoA ligase
MFNNFNTNVSFRHAGADQVALDPPAIESEQAAISIPQDGCGREQGVCGHGAHHQSLEFWESDHTRPAFFRTSDPAPEYFRTEGPAYLKSCMEHPFLAEAQMRQKQFARIKELVEIAYNDIPVYRDKYRAAGFSPDDLRNSDDIEKIPVITKQELIAAFPDRCLHPAYRREDLFATRSSGSSGQTLLIRVDYDAILADTIQGVRQFALASDLKYRPDHLLAHVYTVPWWFSSVGGEYPTAFISNLLPPKQVASHLRDLAPRIVSCYPSNLEALMPHADEFSAGLYLAVTHSEYSTRSARKMWGLQLGCPVLDEYSSEEATRIALELPCGHYHVCEDSVRLDVLDPVTMQPQVPGRSGIAVVTNLLNQAMPFIRYVQGDCVTRPATASPCAVNWSQIATIDGRMNDAFVNRYGRKVPAGSLLDATYRWMFDCDLHLAQFEVIQKRTDLVEVRCALGEGTTESRVLAAASHLEDLLTACLEHPVTAMISVIGAFAPRTGKRRPIRCEVSV